MHNNHEKLRIRATDNLGTCKGNNLGAQNAVGDKLFFLNSDTILINNAVDILAEYLDDNPRVGIVGGNIYSPNLKPTHSFFKSEYNVKNFKKINSLFSTIRNRIFHHRVDFNYSEKPVEIFGFITGADLMIRRKIFEKIGGFDENIFMYAEEPVLCNKAKKLQYKMFSVPEAKIIHLEGASDAKIFSDFKAHNYVFGNYYYFAKCYGRENAEEYKKAAIRIYSRKGTLYRLIVPVKSINYRKLATALKELNGKYPISSSV